ncbi:MAG: hypothetical protein NTY09_09485, partial [bacterium]|nr:hypothetical protein [bacterium]
MLKNILIAALTILFFLAIASPVVAGPSVWNDAGTCAAYIDLVAPGADYVSDKTVFFYEEETGNRYRGTYFPLGAHLSGTQIGYLPADEVSIVEWVNNDTVLVATSNSWDETGLIARYKVSLDGFTVFDGFENLNNRNRDMIPLNVPDEWNFLTDSLACEQFLTDLCAGDV